MLDFSTTIPRERLDPQYADGFGRALLDTMLTARPIEEPVEMSHDRRGRRAIGVRRAFEPGRPSPTRLAEADGQVIARHRRNVLVTEDKNDRPHGGDQRPKRASQMSQLQGAIYARLLSDQQAQGGTTASPVVAMRGRVAQDGFILLDEMMSIDGVQRLR